jgi:gentisate 1,2-dioxygenase
MANRIDDTAAPTVLVGEAVEDWTGDATFYEYSAAADPIGSGAISGVPIRRFSPRMHDGGPSRIIPLDLSGELGVSYPATSPALLASFVIIRPGEAVSTEPDATSELYYCLHGRGSSEFQRAGAFDAPRTGRIDWHRGDFVTLPAGCSTVHAAATDPTPGEPAEALLYRVTDAPLLHYLGVMPSEARFAPTRFDGEVALARLAEVERHPDASTRNRVSILLGNAATPQTMTVTHTLWAMLGVLPADRVQRPHRHQSVALDLITSCDPGCYSLIGSHLDAEGAIVDPVRIDWEAEGAFVTPPGLWHSHHNESGRPAYLVPIQDAGLHSYLRSLDIRFASAPD